MSEQPTDSATTPPEKGRRGLLVIGIIKLGYAIMLGLASFGAFRLLNKDVGEVFENFIMHLHLDPGNKLITKTAAFLSGIDEKHLKVIGFGTLAYTVLDLIEGIGLMLEKTWAEYLTIFITASLLPLEIYELVHKLTIVRTGVLAINLTIVAYLVWQLLQHQRTHHPKSNAQ